MDIDDELNQPYLSGDPEEMNLGARLVQTAFAVSILEWHNLIFLVLSVLVFFLAKKMYSVPFLISQKAWHSIPDWNLDDQLTSADNKAVAISYSGFMAGIGFILRGALSKINLDIGITLLNALMWTTLGFLFLFVTQILNDKIILRRFFNQKGLIAGNMATGILEAGSYIASGLIVGAGLEGSLESILDSFLTALLWFSLGQILVILFTFLYKKITRYDDVVEIAKGNTAAALGFSMTMIALGILLANPIRKSDSMLAFVFSFFLGLIVLTLSRLLVDRLIIPKKAGRNLDREIEEDQNWGASFIEGLVALGIALALTTFLSTVIICPGNAPIAA